MLDWKKHKLESRLPGEMSITSDMTLTAESVVSLGRTEGNITGKKKNK